MSDLTFRVAVASDIPEVLSFWAMAAEDSGRPVDTADALERLIKRDAEALTVVIDRDAVVGTIVAGWDGWRGHLYRLAVHPEYRRQGIARELVTKAEERLARLGGSRADAMVLDANDSAHQVWARTGYRHQPDWSRWVKTI